MSAPIQPELEALLAHARWARALAASLVRDSHRADDLVQRTWIAALEHPPADSTPLKRWLALVMRNFARQDARADVRRAAREAGSARAESVPPHDEVESQAELQRMLLDAVRALDEPYRSTIWARYYEGLAPRRIAARDRVPVKTVKTRLVRGLNELRARFDRENKGNRSAWTALLMPLVHPPHLAGAAFGALIVNTQIKIACALLAVVGAVLVWRTVSSSPSLEPEPRALVPHEAPALAAEPEAPSALTQPSTPAEPRRSATEAPVVAPPAATTSAAPRVVHGRVVDLDHRGIGGLDVVVKTGSTAIGRATAALPTDPTAVVSRADGRFDLNPPHGSYEMVARGANWVTLFSAYDWSESKSDEATIFVAQSRLLAGLVVDASHRPINDASVSFVVSPSIRRNLDAVLDRAMPMEWRVHTDLEGHFELPDAPIAPGELTTEAVSYKVKSITPPDHPESGLVIVLEPIGEKHLVVRGHVVDPEQNPVEGAYVVIGGQTVETHADGAFAFDLDDAPAEPQMEEDPDGGWRPAYKSESIVAVKKLRLPARVDLPPIEELRRSPGTPEYTLVIGGPPLEIQGRVVDAEDHPVGGAMVRSREETPFGLIDFTIAGEGVKLTTSVEKLLRGGFNAQDAVSKADGSFTVTGLLDREYTLGVLDKTTLRSVVSAPIRGGVHDAILRLPSEKDCVHVAGRVVSTHGDPIADISVHLGCAIDPYGVAYGAVTQTDAHGRFEFPRVVRDGWVMQVESPNTFLVLQWSPKPTDDLEHLEIRVSRRCHVQVDLGERKDRADQFVILDSQGEHVQMMSVHGSVSWMPTKVAIVDGRSESVACEETGRLVVLYKGDKEVERVPFTPDPSELVTVRP